MSRLEKRVRDSNNMEDWNPDTLKHWLEFNTNGVLTPEEMDKLKNLNGRSFLKCDIEQLKSLGFKRPRAMILLGKRD